MAKTEEAQPQKVKLTVSMILADLSNGIDRKGIKEKYNLSTTDVARLFQHEKLKGARVRVAPSFELEDDTAEDDLIKETKPVVKKASKPKDRVTTEVAPTPANAVAQSEVAEGDEEEVVAEVLDGQPIKEVATPDDVEVVETKKGLW